MKQKISNELQEALKYNLSFAGCGFLGIYHGMISYNFCDNNFSRFLFMQLVLPCVSKNMRHNCCCKRFLELPPVHWLQHAY